MSSVGNNWESQNTAKIFKSYIFYPVPPQRHVMSAKCDEPIDEIAVQVWLLYHHPNFKYCTLFVCGTELRTDRQTDGRTEDPITRCPRRTFQGQKKTERNRLKWSQNPPFASVLFFENFSGESLGPPLSKEISMTQPYCITTAYKAPRLVYDPVPSGSGFSFSIHQ